MTATDRPSPLSSRPPLGRALLAAFVVVALLVAIFAVWRFTAQKQSVVLFGDSITFITEAVFEQTMGDEYGVTTDGVAGDRTDQRVGEAAAHAGNSPAQVIVNLGTNDVMQATSLDTAVISLDQIGQTFSGARCVHLVTVNENLFSLDDPQLSPRAGELNRRIRDLAKLHGWRVIEWDRIVREYAAGGSPEGPLTTDTVHPTEVGMRRLATAYEDALDACAS